MLLPAEEETKIWSEMSNSFRSLYGERILVSIAFHTEDPAFLYNRLQLNLSLVNTIVTKKKNARGGVLLVEVGTCHV